MNDFSSIPTWALICGLLLTTTGHAAKYLPGQIEHNDSVYEQCNSFTLRYGLVIKVAEIGWYAPSCAESPPILQASNKIVRFHYFKNVKADFFKQSAAEYFLKNLPSEAEKQQLTAVLNEFNSGYTDIADGEYFDLVHSAGDQLKLFKNDQLLAVANNAPFSQQYFNIWFGQEPVIDRLKSAFSDCSQSRMTC
ncbi:chalcone isomerase family protein [Marinicella meishanensis]|uniref:chalcone isomerase family protein n=1 Tax=Marinicella meishanensis TaxID=2873263 RepID=UPI001CC16C6D|nr:chalcone isomerase family protein [Marinicella sp. NBU2979]